MAAFQRCFGDLETERSTDSLMLVPCGPPPGPLSIHLCWGLPVLPLVLLLARSGLTVRACACSQPSSCASVPPSRMSLSEQLRQLGGPARLLRVFGGRSHSWHAVPPGLALGARRDKRRRHPRRQAKRSMWREISKSRPTPRPRMCRQTHPPSSWADGLHMIRRRHPLVTDLIIRELSSDQPAHHLGGVVRSTNRLEDPQVGKRWLKSALFG